MCIVTSATRGSETFMDSGALRLSIPCERLPLLRDPTREDRVFKNLIISRPLAVLDLETTGTDPQTARIVEISVLRLTPPDDRVQRTRRVDPEIPIPAEATAVHGITDADVADELTFSELA